MPFIFLIGFGVGWVMVAIGQFLWRHKGMVAIAMVALMILGMIGDGVDVLVNGSIASRTRDVSLTFMGTRDISTRNMGSSDLVFDLRIANNSDKTMKEFTGKCGEYDFDDVTPVPAHTTVTRPYGYIVTGKALSDCVFTNAVMS